MEKKKKTKKEETDKEQRRRGTNKPMKLRLSMTTIAIYFLFTILWATLFTHASDYEEKSTTYRNAKRKRKSKTYLNENETTETDGNSQLIKIKTNENMRLITMNNNENLQLIELKEDSLRQILAYLDLRDLFTKMNVLCKIFQIIVNRLVHDNVPQLNEEMNKLPENAWIKKMMTNFTIHQIDLFQNHLVRTMTVRLCFNDTWVRVTLDGILKFGQEEAFSYSTNVKLFKSTRLGLLVLHNSNESDRTLSYFKMEGAGLSGYLKLLKNVKSIFIKPNEDQFICLTDNGSLYYDIQDWRDEYGLKKIDISTHIQDEINTRGIKEVIPIRPQGDAFGIYFKDHSLMIWDISKRSASLEEGLLLHIENVIQFEYIENGIVLLNEQRNIILFKYDSNKIISKNMNKIENLDGKEMKIQVEEIKVAYNSVAARLSNGQVIFWNSSEIDDREPEFSSEPLNTFCENGVDKIFATKTYFIALKKNTENGLICWDASDGEPKKIYKYEDKKNLLIEDIYQKNESEFIVIFSAKKENRPLTLYLS